MGERLKGTPLGSHSQFAIELEYNALSRMQFENGLRTVQGDSCEDQECDAEDTQFFIGDMQDTENMPVSHRKKRKSLSTWYNEDVTPCDKEDYDTAQMLDLESPPETPRKENGGNRMLFTPVQSKKEEFEVKSSPSSSP